MPEAVYTYAKSRGDKIEIIAPLQTQDVATSAVRPLAYADHNFSVVEAATLIPVNGCVFREATAFEISESVKAANAKLTTPIVASDYGWVVAFIPGSTTVGTVMGRGNGALLLKTERKAVAGDLLTRLRIEFQEPA